MPFQDNQAQVIVVGEATAPVFCGRYQQTLSRRRLGKVLPGSSPPCQAGRFDVGDLAVA